MFYRLTSLHLAVIDNDFQAIVKNAQTDQIHARDDLGLTPLQLAQHLGKRFYQALLGGKFPTHVSAQIKGKEHIEVIPIATLESTFNITYCPFLTFPSYEALRTVIQQCPYILRVPYLAKENYDMASKHQNAIHKGLLAEVYIKWIDEKMGYGLFAASDLAANTYVGEYTGMMRRLYRSHPDHNEYCLHYPTKFWSWNYYAIDAMLHGNLTRFINHSDTPNLQPFSAVENGLLHQIFVTKIDVAAGTQLTFNYGSDFWEKRQLLLGI